MNTSLDKSSPVATHRHDGLPHFTPTFIHDAALAYHKAGLSFIPIAGTGDKRPAFELLPKRTDEKTGRQHATWKLFCDRRPTPREIDRWYRQSPVWYSPGIAVLGGAISGGLEIIDFDNWDIYLAWLAVAAKEHPKLMDKIVWVRSPRPGMHGYFRSQYCGGNQKLAQRQIGQTEGGKPEVKTLVEIKGEGGYVLAPPSPGECHASGKQYRFVTNRDLTDIAVLSRREREALLETARSLNEYSPPPKVPSLPSSSKLFNEYFSRPGDAFNADGQWPDILEPHGWIYTGEGYGGTQHWSRPGKGQGTSATTNYNGNDRLHVFSENAHPLDAGRSYSKFEAYTMLEHNGDFRAAARKLQRRGFGGPPELAGPLPSLTDDYVTR